LQVVVAVVLKIQFSKARIFVFGTKVPILRRIMDNCFEGQACKEVHLFGLPEGNKQIPCKGQARSIVAVIDCLRIGLSVACCAIQIGIPE
jgi:hypothetical protein